jgi:hypothetical protein
MQGAVELLPNFRLIRLPPHTKRSKQTDFPFLLQQKPHTKGCNQYTLAQAFEQHNGSLGILDETFEFFVAL